MWPWPKFSAVLNQRASSFRRLRMNSAGVMSFNDECVLSWLYSLRQLSSLSCASSSDRNQWMFRHSSRRLPLNDSINGLSVGFPGREKSIVTPCSYAHLSRLFEINSLPLSVWIRTGRRLPSTRNLRFFWFPAKLQGHPRDAFNQYLSYSHKALKKCRYNVNLYMWWIPLCGGALPVWIIFALCESSVGWRRLTGRHPAPHFLLQMNIVTH